MDPPYENDSLIRFYVSMWQPYKMTMGETSTPKGGVAISKIAGAPPDVDNGWTRQPYPLDFRIRVVQAVVDRRFRITDVSEASLSYVPDGSRGER